MAARPLEGKESIPLADGYQLDLRPRRLRHGGRVLKLERIPLEILFLLIEHNGEIVGREEIVSRIWGQGVFLDTDNSIRGAIRKLRQALKDDAETPRFIQTVTGRGYRFIGSFPVSQHENDTAQIKEVVPQPPRSNHESAGKVAVESDRESIWREGEDAPRLPASAGRPVSRRRDRGNAGPLASSDHG